MGPNSRDANELAARIEQMMADVRDHLQSDIGEVGDPRAKALFETTREVLNGLVTAFQHFQTKAELAWT